MKKPSSSEPVVHVVDDDEALRTSLRRLLRAAGRKVRTHASAADFLDEFDAGEHGCLILDLQMKGMDGLDLQRALADAGHRLPIIFMSGHGSISSAVHATQAGAFHFLEKPFASEELLEWVQKALAEDLNRRQEKALTQSARDQVASLTPREYEVVELIVQGLRSREIAAQFGVRPGTIDAHRSVAMRKLGAKTIAELAAIAIEGGIGGKKK